MSKRGPFVDTFVTKCLDLRREYTVDGKSKKKPNSGRQEKPRPV